MSDHLKPIIEALIFASPEPITPKTLYKLLDGEPKEDVDAALAAVRADYDRPCGLQIVEVAGGYQVTTKPELHEWVRKLFHERTTSKLSVQSLETLAVIAYKQPVTAPEIAEIRGVSSSSGVLQTLIERKLIKTVGRKQVVGRPFMYGTTREFLDRFGLNDIARPAEGRGAVGRARLRAAARPRRAHGHDVAAAVRGDLPAARTTTLGTRIRPNMRKRCMRRNSDDPVIDDSVIGSPLRQCPLSETNVSASERIPHLVARNLLSHERVAPVAQAVLYCGAEARWIRCCRTSVTRSAGCERPPDSRSPPF